MEKTQPENGHFWNEARGKMLNLYSKIRVQKTLSDDLEDPGYYSYCSTPQNKPVTTHLVQYANTKWG